MTECIPHPDDPSRWLPVDEAWERVWRDHGVAFALIEAHDKRHAGTDQSVAALWAAIKAQDAAHVDDMRALGGLVAELSTRLGETVDALAEQGVWLTELEARVKALEPRPALGIDVSKYQTVEQAAANLQSEPDFCIINATTGLFTTSSALATHTANSRAHANVTGFYHWSQTVNDSATTPDKSDPLGEALHFISTTKPQHGDILALDHEQALGTWAQRVAYAIAWLDETRARTGALPLLYINGDWLYNLWTAASAEQRQRLFGVYYLWYARPTGKPGDYGTTAKYRPDTYPGVKVLVHQYAIDGGDIDRNWCPDFDTLRRIAVP